MTDIAAGSWVTPTVRLTRPLTKGGMGKVWLGHHKTLDCEVVVKFLSAALSDDAQSRERFGREAAAAAKVRSPHVVQMFDHGVLSDGVPFMVMEFLSGKDLAQVLRGRSLAPDQVGNIIEQVARALDAAHRQGIIHRDVKPANIFMIDVGARDPFVKLLDFGVAKTTQLMTLTTTGEIVGTPVYMSPEHIAARPMDHRADLWSLAVVAYRALTGKRPFDGDSVAQVAYAVVHKPLPLPSRDLPSLPATLDAWFARACARDPEARFQSAREMADAYWQAIGMTHLQSWTGETPAPVTAQLAPTVLDRPPTLGSLRSSAVSVPPPPRRRGLMIALAAGLPIALVIGWLASSAFREDPAPAAAAPSSTMTEVTARAPGSTATAAASTPPSASASAPAAASASATASASASASAAAEVAPKALPRPRPRPRLPEPQPSRRADPDDLGF